MTRRPVLEYERLLKPYEAAAYLGIRAETLVRWANQGKLFSIRTAGGRDRRYREAEVLALAAARQEHQP